METRKNILKSINTVKTLSKSVRMPSLASNTSETLRKKLEVLLNDETTASSSDLLNCENDYLIPYTFRVLLPENGTKTNHAKTPPFYMQLDHTIAVLWHVFAQNKNHKKHIGIGQLQWALYFLKAIKDPLEGTRQADIDVAIKAIEDTLIECYAEMANLVMKKNPIQSKSSIPSLIVPEKQAKIGESASLGIMVKPRRSFCQVEELNISSLSYTSLDIKPDISTTLEELIKFRNATQEKKLKFRPTKYKPVPSTQENNHDNFKGNDAYEMLRILREDQVMKLNIEIENLRRIEEAARNVYIQSEPATHYSAISQRKYEIFAYTTLGHATHLDAKNTQAELHLNSKRKWFLIKYYTENERSEGYDSIFETLVHEIGHNLGLDHNRNTNSIMYPYALKKIYFKSLDEFKLPQADIDNIKSLYKI